MLSRCTARHAVRTTRVLREDKFSNVSMTSHTRSNFQYKGSSAGEDVGARNEAAFIKFTDVEFKPTEPSRKYAMPSTFNMLTMMPLNMALLIGGSVGYGISMWSLYASRKYQVVTIERPANL